MRSITFGAVLAFTGLSASAPLNAAIVQIVASQDNTLYEHAEGALSNGAGQSFFVGRNSQGLIRRGLIAFDVAGAVPASSTIISVSLTLHCSQGNDGLTDVGLYRSLSAWGEGSSIAPGAGGGGGPAAIGDATWLHTFYADQFWTNPGGDFALTASAVAAVGEPGFFTWQSSTMIADVQTWLDAPLRNFGWGILGDESDLSTAKRFDSRENENLAFRPLLTIEYAPIPAPGALPALLGASCLLGARRRRQASS